MMAAPFGVSGCVGVQRLAEKSMIRERVNKRFRVPTTLLSHYYNQRSKNAVTAEIATTAAAAVAATTTTATHWTGLVPGEQQLHTFEKFRR